MIRLLSLSLVCASVLTIQSFFAHAVTGQDPVIGGAEVVKLESFTCRKLAMHPDSSAQHGYIKMLTAPEGKAFLVCWTTLKLTFGKNEDGEEAVYIEDEHVSLKDSKGNVARVVGTCTRDGRFGERSAYISEYKEYLDSDEVTFQPVFVVNEDEQEFTMNIATHAKKFTGPMQVANTIDRTGAATFKIGEVKVLDNLKEVRSLRRYSDDEVKGVTQEVLSPSTRFLSVKFLIKPRYGTDSDGDASFNSGAFGLRYGAQVYSTPIGYYSGRDFYDGTTGEYAEKDAAGEFPAMEMHLVFPVPGKLTSFRAMYMMQEFGGAAIPQ